MVVDGLTDHLTHATPNTGFLRHGEMQRRHIHHKRVRWTLRHACIASLSRRTESIRNRRDSHVDLVDLDDWQERVCSTCCDAGKVFAEETGRLIGKKNGGVVLRMYDDRAGR